MLAKNENTVLEQEFNRIMAYANGMPNDETYACMLASWQQGDGVMSDDFGLGAEGFINLLTHHYPGLAFDSLTLPGRVLDESRNDEGDDVFKLLISNRVGKSPSEEWMARIVAAACQGQDHLWQDMGLWSRSQLTELLMRNFPALAEKNIHNMKWKKFLYKQLCITEGIYTCRAPSCEVCADYSNCFGSEEI